MQCHVISRLSKLSLQSTSIRQQTLEIALDCLKIRVSSNVLLLDVDVGDRSLAVDLLQCGLDGRSIIYHIHNQLLFTFQVAKVGYIPT